MLCVLGHLAVGGPTLRTALHTPPVSLFASDPFFGGEMDASAVLAVLAGVGEETPLQSPFAAASAGEASISRGGSAAFFAETNPKKDSISPGRLRHRIHPLVLPLDL